ncbi:MAG: hypothetical protein ACOCRX_00930 [Candidatus Woesearchaeota archaeon]
MEGRIKINFPTLEEKEEIALISELNDFIIWIHQKDRLNKNISEEPTIQTLVDFWINKIGKSQKIEEMLNDINVIADVFIYIEKYQEKIIELFEKPMRSIHLKDSYRTEDEAELLKETIKKINKNKKALENENYKEIIKYLKENGYDLNHISSNYTKRIIGKLKQILKRCQYSTSML